MLKAAGAELMTQEDLAKAMGLARSTISAKINGRALLTLKEANRIKSILGAETPIEELFQDLPPRAGAGSGNM